MTTVDLNDARVVDAIAEFLADIAKHSAALPAEDVATAEFKRTQAVVMLQATAVLFHTLGLDPAGQNIDGLAAALDDLDRGKVHAMLVPVRRGSRPPDSSDVWSARARVAIAVACLRRGNLSDNDTIKKIRKCKHLDSLLSGTTGNIETAPFNWLKAFREHGVNNPTALTRWQSFREFEETGPLGSIAPDVWAKIGEGMLLKADAAAAAIASEKK